MSIKDEITTEGYFMPQTNLEDKLISGTPKESDMSVDTQDSLKDNLSMGGDKVLSDLMNTKKV